MTAAFAPTPTIQNPAIGIVYHSYHAGEHPIDAGQSHHGGAFAIYIAKEQARQNPRWPVLSRLQFEMPDYPHAQQMAVDGAQRMQDEIDALDLPITAAHILVCANPAVTPVAMVGYAIAEIACKFNYIDDTASAHEVMQSLRTWRSKMRLIDPNIAGEAARRTPPVRVSASMGRIWSCFAAAPSAQGRAPCQNMRVILEGLRVR